MVIPQWERGKAWDQNIVYILKKSSSVKGLRERNFICGQASKIE